MPPLPIRLRLALLVVLALAASTAAASERSTPLAAHVAGEILIRFASDEPTAFARDAIDAARASVIRKDDRLDYYRVRLGDQSVEDAIQHFSALPGVEWVEPNYHAWLFACEKCPQDPDLLEAPPALPASPSGWHAFETGLHQLWRWAGAPAATVRIGIVDTGDDPTHPDLSPTRAATGHYDFAYNDAVPNDVDGHGSHVAGIACAASNTIGGAGVAYCAEYVAIRVFDDGGIGTSDWIAQGIAHAGDETDVINLSLGAPANQAMYEAITYALEQGAVIVAASGNDGGPVAFPANVRGVIAVGSTEPGMTVAASSNWGSELDVVAPGAPVWSTKLGGGYENRSGTSMAAPFVAGVCALLRATWSAATAVEMESFLKDRATDLPGDHDGAGMLVFGPSEDWSDAPGFAAARHRNFAHEWIGADATNETSLADPLDTDGRPNTDATPYGRDAGDDGTFPGSYTALPILPPYFGAPAGSFTTPLTVCDRDGDRYGIGAEVSLHFDIWADWDSDLSFDDAGEHPVADLVLNPAGWAANTELVSSLIAPPARHLFGNPVTVRSRLNYGAAMPAPDGAAAWGEVEDARFVNMVEDFDAARYAEPPFFAMGGWFLRPDSPPCTNRGAFTYAAALHPPTPPCDGTLGPKVAMSTPTFDLVEHTTAKLRFWYCHEAQCPMPGPGDACRIDFYRDGALDAGVPIPTGAGTFEIDISALCGSPDVRVEFICETDKQGWLFVDDVVVWGYDLDPPAPLAAPAIAGSASGVGTASATVSWTAVDENVTMGPPHEKTANAYQLRVAPSPIVTAADWENAMPVRPKDVAGAFPIPGVPGGTAMAAFRVPTAFGARHAAVRVGDEVVLRGAVAPSAADADFAFPSVSVVSGGPASGAPGDTVELTLNVTNTGNLADLILISTSATDTADWEFRYDDPAVGPVARLLLPLIPLESQIVPLSVRIPWTASGGDTNRVSVTAVSLNSPAAFGIDIEDVVVIDSTTSVDAPADVDAPARFALAIVGANPSSAQSRVRLDLPVATSAALRVYDSVGRLVRTLRDGVLEAGRLDVVWDGADDSGRQVASGVYLFRVESSGATQSAKIVRVR